MLKAMAYRTVILEPRIGPPLPPIDCVTAGTPLTAPGIDCPRPFLASSVPVHSGEVISHATRDDLAMCDTAKHDDYSAVQ
jgi:hypothetical protein